MREYKVTGTYSVTVVAESEDEAHEQFYESFANADESQNGFDSVTAIEGDEVDEEE